MNKTLETKIQKIVPKTETSANNIAGCILIEPDNETTQEKKGTVYATYELQSQHEFETNLVNNIVYDVIHDAYYQSEDTSPIQALEKAILKLRDNIVKLSKTSAGSDDTFLSFSITATALWGNSLYIVQYGDTKTFLLRENAIKEVDAANEGKFSVSYGVVKNDDIVIVTTKAFAERFPPEKLTELANLSAASLENNQACLIMKFKVISEMSENEKVDIKVPNNNSSLSRIENNIQNKGENELNGASKIRMPKVKLPNLNINFKKLSIVILLALLIGGGVYGAYYLSEAFFNNEATSGDQPVATTMQIENDEAEDSDIRLGQQRVPVTNENIFYDLRMIDQNISVDQIKVIGSNIFALNLDESKMYISPLSIPKFVPVGISLQNIVKILESEEELAIVEDGDLVLLDAETYREKEVFLGNLEGPVATYLEFVYEIRDNNIVRYSKGSSRLNETVWTSNESLANAIDLGIDRSIYVLNSTGVDRYTTGAKVSFEITGMETTLSNPTQIIVDVNLTNIYIADSGNKRVVVIDKEGSFISEFKAESETQWENIKSISVSRDGKRLYVLDETRVYEVSLE